MADSSNKNKMKNAQVKSENSDGLVRLSKLMSERGICSRREADDYISRGLVFVDGVKVSELGVKFPPTVKIELAGRAVEDQRNRVTVLLNKPIGFVSAQPEKDYEPAIKLLGPENYFGEGRAPFDPRDFSELAVAGRLDIDSQGLLVFTQDGRVAKKLIGENSVVEKEYIVRVEGKLSPEGLAKLNYGLSLDGQKLKRAKVEWINQDQLRFVLTEGKKRQVRRMCEAVGLTVRGLKRVRVGKVMLGKLPEGKWRLLSDNEEF